jgi:hypothetical protein
MRENSVKVRPSPIISTSGIRQPQHFKPTGLSHPSEAARIRGVAVILFVRSSIAE